jgi:hypothetical protein
VQLQKYSDQYLGLKAISPPQFVRLADLPNRLPAPRADPPAAPVDAQAETTAQTSAERPSTPALATPAAASDMDEAEADDLPVPPIPPGASPITSVALQAVTAPPLQARPVTPRPAAGVQDLNAARPRPTTETRVVDESRETTGKPASLTGTDPRQVAPGLTSGPLPKQVSGPTRDTQTQSPARPAERTVADNRVNDAQRDGSARGQGLPPLQAQGPARPVEKTVADGRTNDPRRDTRPTQVAEPPRTAGSPAPLAGSLLGMSRGPVPLPIPAPTPVSAAWTGPNSGPGR